MMVGRNLGDLYPPRATAIGAVAFECENLSRFGVVRGVSFEVRHGGILGLAGLVGSGRTEAMRALVNADNKSSGNFWLDGRPIRLDDPEEALAHGVVYLSEDRKGAAYSSLMTSLRMSAFRLSPIRRQARVPRPSALRARAREFSSGWIFVLPTSARAS